MVGHYKLISGAQSRGKANSATTDVILSFVYDIHTAWNHGKVMSALTFDIKGYFDFIKHDRLLVRNAKTLNSTGISEVDINLPIRKESSNMCR